MLHLFLIDCLVQEVQGINLISLLPHELGAFVLVIHSPTQRFSLNVKSDLFKMQVGKDDFVILVIMVVIMAAAVVDSNAFIQALSLVKALVWRGLEQKLKALVVIEEQSLQFCIPRHWPKKQIAFLLMTGRSLLL